MWEHPQRLGVPRDPLLCQLLPMTTSKWPTPRHTAPYLLHHPLTSHFHHAFIRTGLDHTMSSPPHVYQSAPPPTILHALFVSTCACPASRPDAPS